MIVADTHAFIWWFSDRGLLSPRARAAFDANPIGVATITCLEVVRLAERGRFDAGGAVEEWLNDILALPQVTAVPLTTEIAITAAKFAEPLRDPADCIIAATALHLGAPLVTKDRKITESAVVPTIW